MHFITKIHNTPHTTPHHSTHQVVYLDPMVETTYTVWVRNSGLDQPLDTSGLRVTLYTKSGRVKQVMRVLVLLSTGRSLIVV